MLLDKFAWQWGGLKSQINHIYSIHFEAANPLAGCSKR